MGGGIGRSRSSRAVVGHRAAGRCARAPALRSSQARARPGSQYGGRPRSPVSMRNSGAARRVHDEVVVGAHACEHPPVALPLLGSPSPRRARPRSHSARAANSSSESTRDAAPAPTRRAPRARRASAATTNPVSGAERVPRRGRLDAAARRAGAVVATCTDAAVEAPAAGRAAPARSEPDRRPPRCARRATTPAARARRGSRSAIRDAPPVSRCAAATTRIPDSPAPRTHPLQPLEEFAGVVRRQARRERVQVVDHDERPGAGGVLGRARRRHPTRAPRRRHAHDPAARLRGEACAARWTCRFRPARPPAARGAATRTPDRSLPLPLGLVGESEQQRVTRVAGERPRGLRDRCARAAPAARVGAGAGPSAEAAIASQSACDESAIRTRLRGVIARRAHEGDAARLRASGQGRGLVGADHGAAVGRIGHAQADAQRAVGEQALADHARRAAACRARGACPGRDRAPRHR